MERQVVDPDNGHLEPVVEGPEHFHAELPLPRRGRQPGKSIERRAAVSIDADMLKEGGRLGDRRLAQEIPREGHLALGQGCDRLDDGGIMHRIGPRKRRRHRGDVYRLVGEAGEAALHREGINNRKPGIEIDHMAVAALRIAHGKGRCHPVAARGVAPFGDDGIAAMGPHRFGNRQVGGCHQHMADLRLHGPAPDMNHQRHAPDIGQRPPREVARGQPCGDHDDRILLFYHQVGPGRGKLWRVEL